MLCSQVLNNISVNLCNWKIAFFFRRYGLTPESLESVLWLKIISEYNICSRQYPETTKAQFFSNWRDDSWSNCPFLRMYVLAFFRSLGNHTFTDVALLWIVREFFHNLLEHMCLSAYSLRALQTWETRWPFCVPCY